METILLMNLRELDSLKRLHEDNTLKKISNKINHRIKLNATKQTILCWGGNIGRIFDSKIKYLNSN
jgi:hypothetical protein